MADCRCFRAALPRPNADTGTGKKRLTARCKWHFGGGPDYCGACADAELPCSKGKENAKGERCPYCTSEPQTVEGWQAWDVALRCAGQLRMAQWTVVGLDMIAAIKIGEALGYNATGLAELLPACEAGMVAAVNEKISQAKAQF